MVSNKNNGLFDKIKKTIDNDANNLAAPASGVSAAMVGDPGQESEDLIKSIECRLLESFKKEKHQLADELAVVI